MATKMVSTVIRGERAKVTASQDRMWSRSEHYSDEDAVIAVNAYVVAEHRDLHAWFERNPDLSPIACPMCVTAPMTA